MIAVGRAAATLDGAHTAASYGHRRTRSRSFGLRSRAPGSGLRRDGGGGGRCAIDRRRAQSRRRAHLPPAAPPAPPHHRPAPASAHCRLRNRSLASHSSTLIELH
ncbi:unnamed protein product [Euphydryas editha]|uniref:Uncharacterized protein n=1 Tax=Euphydryas editha TaxID=104508 RepID=A0AAU9TUX1_EUPED|nr:unnamed protein product [Euphydryas editha]